MKKTLLTLALMLTTMAAAAQSITNATFSYTFNDEGRRMSCPASGLDVVDLTGTVAENLQINAVTVQTSGSVSSVTMYAANYKSGEKDPEIAEVPLVAQESQPGDEYVWWYIPSETIERMDGGYLVNNNNKSTATRYFSFYFVANKNIYYNNGGSYYSLRYKTDDGQGGGGGQSGSITFYDTNTATLSLSMTGGKDSNINYMYNGDGTRNISDNPGGVSSLQISNFTLRLKRSSADLEIASVSLQYKVYEEGSDGQWNTLNYDFQEDEGGDILAKKYTGTTSTQDLTKGLKQGTTYILEVKYQVVDKNGNYYFFTPSSWYGEYKFSVNGGGGGESVRGDLNGDGEVSIADVMFLIQRILNGKFPDE